MKLLLKSRASIRRKPPHKHRFSKAAKSNTVTMVNGASPKRKVALQVNSFADRAGGSSCLRLPKRRPTIAWLVTHKKEVNQAMVEPLSAAASWQMTCSVACATRSAGRLKSHRSLKPGSWSRPMSLPHRSSKLTLTGFGAGHGSVTLLPKHERPQGGRFHVPSVVTS